jgi:hypothetical protein
MITIAATPGIILPAGVATTAAIALPALAEATTAAAAHLVLAEAITGAAAHLGLLAHLALQAGTAVAGDAATKAALKFEVIIPQQKLLGSILKPWEDE